jgi:hypothetical protein
LTMSNGYDKLKVPQDGSQEGELGP